MHIKTEIANKQELKSCTICDAYLKNGEGFICPKCRRGPLCRNHRLSGNKLCTSCVYDVKAEEMTALRAQEQSIKGFLRMTQFLFLLSVILFVAMKMNLAEIFLLPGPVVRQELWEDPADRLLSVRCLLFPCSFSLFA